MKKSKIAVVMCLCVLIFAFHAEALWVLNGPPTPPPQPGQDGEEVDSTIIDGAADFLQSYAGFLLLLKESERGPKYGFGFPAARSAIDTAYEKLAASQEKYAGAVQAMKELSFEQGVLLRLQEFDFAGLCEKRKLHLPLMNRVSAYLALGNVVGLYNHMIADMDNIAGALASVREQVYNNIQPGLEDLRSLYQSYSGFMLKGYYASLVFAEINGQ